MKIRTECPKKNNKYYNNRAHGGLSDAVNGEPMIRGLTVLDNCVGWANSRFNEIINDPELKGIVKAFKYQLVCNAENFIESAKRQGLKISSTPIEGGIMVWQKGGTLSGSDGAGHVAVVERVYSDGTILTSESGWRSWTFKTVRRDNSNGRWGQNSLYKFRGCIINPSVTSPKVVPVPPLTIDGIGGNCTVRAMQRFFGTVQDGVISGQNRSCSKYYPSLNAVEYGNGGSACVKKLQKWLGINQDGVWGEQTSKALQKKLGVNVDGIFDTADMKVWQKYLNEHKKAVYPQSIKSETRMEKTVNYAKKLAKDPKFHYVHWKKNDPKTKQCPICHNVPKTSQYYGTYCTIFPVLCWHHGGGIKIKCDKAPNNGKIDRIYNAKTDAEALKLAKQYFGIKDIKVIRSRKNIPQNKLKAGDICYHFNSGNTCQHAFLYIGNGKMIDANSVKDPVAIRKAMSCRVAVRYIGK